ncbi:MAG: hypothetical protein ACXW5U_24930 [Thermoanaerobaculia bacterium]
MKRMFSVALLSMLVLATAADAARVRVTKRGPRGRRTTVTVRTGFPIRRTLPAVVVRPAPVVRVAPRAYLAPVAFGAVVVASLPANREWRGSEELEREDGWTDFTMNVDRRGTKLFLQIDRGAAHVSFAEVVFENGEVQVVDFVDRVHRTGVYELLDFRDGRKVDHVRVIAKASTEESEITLHLVS